MKRLKKYMTKEGYYLKRYSKHMIFRNHLLQKSITVSSTPKCETQELKIVQVIVRRQKRYSTNHNNKEGLRQVQ